MKYEDERIILEEMKVESKSKQLNIRLQKKVVHNVFVKKYKMAFALMDILVISMLICNFGAVLITNALVVRENPDIILMEANSVQADLNEYDQHPEGDDFMRSLFIQSLMWAGFLFLYFYGRTHVYTNSDFLINWFIIAFYTYLIYFDFINDLGYLIGIIW